ncbi:MAG: sulfite exporter TauE/SafE family protein [Bryobacteraceae bacterium]|nr:sulfite exporter TauE/SafE family protein [Bryobacteraceae bacterium]
MILHATDPLIFIAAFLAGIINSIAGGGSFLTFPALVIAGVPAVAANATNTLALLPGTFASTLSYRKQLAPIPGIPMPLLLTVSLIGGILGAVLLLKTPESAFQAIAPWLLLFATVVFTFGKQIGKFLKTHFHVGVAAYLILQLIIAVYGGYFGAGVGILTLAVLSLYGMSNIHGMNAVKTLIAGALNTIAAAIFVFSGLIHWRECAVMAVGGIAGGYLGAWGAQRINPIIIRATVIGVGVSMTIWFFIRYYSR